MLSEDERLEEGYFQKNTPTLAINVVGDLQGQDQTAKLNRSMSDLAVNWFSVTVLPPTPALQIVFNYS